MKTANWMRVVSGCLLVAVLGCAVETDQPPVEIDDTDVAAGSEVWLAQGSCDGFPVAVTQCHGDMMWGHGFALYAGHAIVSEDSRFLLVYQTDGNLVIYQRNVGAIWHTRTHGTYPGRAVVQGDGNFVVYDGYGRAVWNTRTAGWGINCYLWMQTDGNLVLYKYTGAGDTWETSIKPIWQSGTCCR